MRSGQLMGIRRNYEDPPPPKFFTAVIYNWQHGELISASEKFISYDDALNYVNSMNANNSKIYDPDNNLIYNTTNANAPDTYA